MTTLPWKFSATRRNLVRRAELSALIVSHRSKMGCFEGKRTGTCVAQGRLERGSHGKIARHQLQPRLTFQQNPSSPKKP